MEPYRPANGTEGACFIDYFCCHCERDRNEDCNILARSFAFSIGDAEYPVEWIRDANGPRCTAFVPRGETIPPPRCTRTLELFGDSAA